MAIIGKVVTIFNQTIYMRMCSVFTTIKVQSVPLRLNWLQFIPRQIIITTLDKTCLFSALLHVIYNFAYLLAFPSGNTQRALRIVLCSAFLRHFRTWTPISDCLTSLPTASRAVRWTAERNLQLEGTFQTLQSIPSCSRARLLSLVI